MPKDLSHAGRYQIISEIGRGSMGVVYRGYDPLIGRNVAIKRMLTEGLKPADYQEYKARFQREAQSAGVLTHPNIVTIYDFGEDQDTLYLAMEFLEGRTLHSVIEERSTLPIEKIIPMFVEICSALDHAHSFKIVHRDIKPANIMVLQNGHVKVTDFGIAKVMTTGMTQTGQILGTPNYMAPEQVTGKGVDGRSDLFSVGVMLYELVTGAKPFGGENITTVIYKIVHENPVPPIDLDSSIHPGLNYVISKALSKRPQDRYQTCGALAEDLSQFRNLGGGQPPSETVLLNAQTPKVSAKVPSPTPKPGESHPAVIPPPAPSASHPGLPESPSQAAVKNSSARPAPPVAPPPSAPAAAPVIAAPRRPDAVLRPPLVKPAAVAKSSSSLRWLLVGILIALPLGAGIFYERAFIAHYLHAIINRQASSAESSAVNTTPPAAAPPSSAPKANAPGSSSAPPAASTNSSGTTTTTSGTPAGTSQPSATGSTPAETSGKAAASLRETKSPSRRSAEVKPAAPVRFGKLEVASNIAGASISIDGESHPGWTTPHLFPHLAAGDHTITVAKDGYGEGASKDIKVVANATRSITMELSKPSGMMYVKTDPPGVEVTCDGKDWGRTSSRHDVLVKLPAGTYTCNLQLSGGKVERKQITIPSNNYLGAQTFDLVGATDMDGTADIRTIPPGATIMVDGNVIGKKTDALVRLAAGKHEINVYLPGQLGKVKQVRIEPGETSHVDVNLQH